MVLWNPTKKFLIQILDGIQLDVRLVEVLTEFPPGNTLPCITMTDSGGRGHLETQIHPRYKKLKQDKEYPAVVEDGTYDCGFIETSTFEESILLHVWSETNAERDEIIQQLIHRLVKAWHGPFKDDNAVQIRNVGTATDLDQYGSYPPLYHSTLPVTLLFTVFSVKDAYPFLKYTKKDGEVD